MPKRLKNFKRIKEVVILLIEKQTWPFIFQRTCLLNIKMKMGFSSPFCNQRFKSSLLNFLIIYIYIFFIYVPYKMYQNTYWKFSNFSTIFHFEESFYSNIKSAIFIFSSSLLLQLY